MKNWHFQLSYFHLYLSKCHKAKIEMESFYNVSLYCKLWLMATITMSQVTWNVLMSYTRVKAILSKEFHLKLHSLLESCISSFKSKKYRTYKIFCFVITTKSLILAVPKTVNSYFFWSYGKKTLSIFYRQNDFWHFQENLQNMLILLNQNSFSWVRL